jgi:hypothetical protein
MRFVALFLILASQALTLGAATYDWSATGLSGNRQAEFRLWIPDDLKTVREVLILIPGRDGDGRSMAEDPAWQELASRWGIALIGCRMTGSSYQLAGEWSGQALVQSLRELGNASQHPELANARQFFYGHSAGAYFITSFLGWRSGLISGFAVVNASNNRWFITDHHVKMPGLWILGENDSDERREQMEEGFARGRRMGGQWAFAIQPGTGHELGNAREFVLEFFDALFRDRRTNSAGLTPWIGSLRTHEISPALDFRADGSLNSWLPDEQFARKWQEFVTAKNPKTEKKGD